MQKTIMHKRNLYMERVKPFQELFVYWRGAGNKRLGKRILELHEKYYLGDIALRHALLGYREADIAGMLENLVFLELKRRGYNLFIGKYGTREIDFIATKADEKLYIQVCYLLASEQTIEREFQPLLSIKDNYPKYVLSMDTIFGSDYDGIKRLNIVDFLLQPIDGR